MLCVWRRVGVLLVSLALSGAATPALGKAKPVAQGMVNGEKLYATQPSGQRAPEDLISKLIRAETKHDMHLTLECVQGTPTALTAFQTHLQLADAGQKFAKLISQHYGGNGWSYIENYLSNANIPVIPTLPDADAVQNDADNLHAAKITILGDIAQLNKDGSTVMQFVRYKKIWRLDLNSLDSSKTDKQYEQETVENRRLLIAVNKAKGLVARRPNHRYRGVTVEQAAIALAKFYAQARAKP